LNQNRLNKNKMKEFIKIYLTNWINLLIIFTAVYIGGFISAIVNDKFTTSEALFGTTYSVVLYGMIFWIGFITCLFVLDLIMFSVHKDQQYITFKLLIEWLIISAPFIYWLVKYGQWIFGVAVIAFLLGQYLRRPYIFKVLAL
jgi:hypothetical protein